MRETKVSRRRISGDSATLRAAPSANSVRRYAAAFVDMIAIDRRNADNLVANFGTGAIVFYRDRVGNLRN